MKKLITLLCFLPLASFAQKNEIGINGGISLNTNFMDSRSYTNTMQPSFYYSFSYARKFKNWQTGIKLVRHQVKSEYNSVWYPFESDIYELWTGNLIVFVNRLLYTDNHQLYAGINAGWIGLYQRIGAGVQLGDIYFFNRWLGANAELGFSYYDSGRREPRKSGRDMVVVPLTLGIRVRL